MKYQTIKSKIINNKLKSGLVMLLVVIVGYYGYKNIFSSAGEPSYVVNRVERGTVVSSISGSGQVSSSNQIDLKAKASGDILRTYAQAGKSIRAGELIAEIDSRDARLTYESAQVAFDKLTKPADIADVQSAQSALNRSYNDGWNAISNVFIAYPDMMKKMDDLFYTTNGYLFDSSSHSDTIRAYIMKAGANYDAAKLQYETVLKEYNSLTRTSAPSSIDLLIEDTHQMVKKNIEAMKDTQNAISYIVDINSDTSTTANTAATNVNNWLSSLNSQLSSILVAQGSILTNTTALNNLIKGADSYDVRSQAISLEQKRNAYSDYFIRAPFDGVVGRMNVKVGDSASGGTVIATMISKSQMADISLNEVDAAKVKIGNKATLTFDAIDGLTMTGTISELDLVGTINQGVVTYNAKVAFDTEDSRILAGMSVSASIITDVKNDTLFVPASAVKSDTKGSYVQIFNPPLVASSTAPVPSKIVPEKLYIETGLLSDNAVEIISGLNEGDQVVVRTVSATTATPAAAPSLFGGGARTTTTNGANRATSR
ncbi:MAG: efflux RND transporter periplasmic adaptor subunit [Minisyncoccia bacterium]